MSDNAVTVERIASIVGQGGEWSRHDLSVALGRAKTTHVIQTIERGVSLGLYARSETVFRGKTAYFYRPISTQQKG
jgi:predicted transcriptional regulator